MIKIQREDFDIGAELAQLTDGNTKVGGLASFVGLVRDLADQGAVSAMTLEHYPGMTEKRLAEIEAEARSRWPLESVLIIHRYGKLEPGDRIVLVATTSAHRQAALESCAFLIDWLKTKAPFWKLEEGAKGAAWVEAKDKRRPRRGEVEAVACSISHIENPPPPTRGRVGVGEASEDSISPKRGFPLPTLPHFGGGKIEKGESGESYSAARLLAGWRTSLR